MILLTVYRINEYDLVVEDRVNGVVRVLFFNRKDSLSPTTWTVPYGKDFIEDFTMMLIYRTTARFKNDFIKYCIKNNVFQEILKNIKVLEKRFDGVKGVKI